MNILKNISVWMLLVFVLSGCNETKETKQLKDEVMAHEVASDMKKITLDIEGMTCEIGCARTIQSKLSKAEGVKLAQVNFAEKKGIVEYDANLISRKEIIATVERIADGDLYKVSNASDKE